LIGRKCKYRPANVRFSQIQSGLGVRKRGPQSGGFTATDHKELGILTRKKGGCPVGVDWHPETRTPPLLFHLQLTVKANDPKGENCKVKLVGWAEVAEVAFLPLERLWILTSQWPDSVI